MNHSNLRDGKRALSHSAGWPLRAVTGYLERGGVSLHVQVKMDFEQLQTFRPDQIAAIMDGIGKITAANRAEASAPDNHRI